MVSSFHLLIIKKISYPPNYADIFFFFSNIYFYNIAISSLFTDMNSMWEEPNFTFPRV